MVASPPAKQEKLTPASFLTTLFKLMLCLTTCVLCAAGASASRGLRRVLTDSTPTSTKECLIPSSDNPCYAEFQAWCDGTCMMKGDDAVDDCETLCEANPDNGNAIECTPSLLDDQLPCFAARSPEDYPGVAYTSIENAKSRSSLWYVVEPCTYHLGYGYVC